MKLKKSIVFALAWAAAVPLFAADTNCLTLTGSIPLPDVRGRIDHLAFDVPQDRLFVAALGNDTIEVVDPVDAGTVRSLKGCSTPQGLAYVAEPKRLVVANGGSGEVAILDGGTFKPLGTVGNLPDADNVRYDDATGLVYAGYGDGALAVIQLTNGQLVASIKLPGHPESFQLEKNGRRIFVNVPDARQIAVIDRATNQMIATWAMGEFHANFPMALDEANHRLLVGCRHPARLVVLDTTTGKRVSEVEIAGDTDDVFYDSARKRAYVSCGAGFIDVIDQRDADTYRLRERIPTVSGARTSYFSPEKGELYLAVRAGMISGKAEIRVYKAQ